MNTLQLIFLITFWSKCLKAIKNYILVYEPFDTRIDPGNPTPKKKLNLSINVIESEIIYLYDLIETIPENKNNSSKKER